MAMPHITYELGAMIGAGVAGVAALVALIEYGAAQRWKRAEFAISQIRLLAQDPTLAFCCRAIDWGVGPLIVPDRYRDLLPTRTVEHDWALMAEALKPKLSALWKDERVGPQFLLYRYAFDDFCGYLDTIALCRELKVIRPDDLSAIEDYLKQMLAPKYWRNRNGIADADLFCAFVKRFYFSRVWKWMASLPVAHDQTLPMTTAGPDDDDDDDDSPSGYSLPSLP
jgi:hypothetical protein